MCCTEETITNKGNITNDNDFIENDIIELLEHNKTIVSNIEKSNDLITKAQNSFINIQNNFSYLRSKNLELEKQIELLTIENEKEVQAVRNEMSELEEDKNNKIGKLNIEIEVLQEEKNNRIKELENEILSVKQSYDDEIKLLNSSFENFKIEKEEEINNLHKEIDRIRAEGEKDKQVLDEFQNMIKILEKIKGIFKKKNENSNIENY